MEKDLYEKLRSLLHTQLIGAPDSEQIREILRAKFTPAEAELALSLSPLSTHISEIAKNVGKSEDEIRPVLEGMADKGLVQNVKKDEASSQQYNLLPTVPGIFETSFGDIRFYDREVDPRTKQLACLWQEYYDVGFGEEIHSAKTPLTRIIPVNRAVDADLEVLHYERAAEILKVQNYYTLCNCCCRVAAREAGKGCDYPIDTCMHLGDFGRFLVDRGYAKEITYEKAMEVLERTDEAGLIHLTINTEEQGCLAICSCCACCCVQLKGISKLKRPGAVASSRFYPVVNEEECTACGTCEERCQMEAIAVKDDVAEVTLERCIGCGICVTGCPVEAIHLQERESSPKIYPSIEELAGQVMKEKGKI